MPQVVCRELGAPSDAPETSTYIADFYYELPTWMADVNCTGQEARLLDCAFSSNVLQGPRSRAPLQGGCSIHLGINCHNTPGEAGAGEKG